MKRLALLPVLALAACTVGPNYAPPAAPLPAQWQAANALPLPPAREWWRDFGDPALDALVARALAANPDVDAALARIEQAEAQAGLARAAQLPAGAVNAQIARSRQSLEAGIGQIARYIPSFPRTVDNAQLGLSARWELDLAGGNRRQREAALAGLAGARAGADAARLLVAGAVTESYLRLTEAERRLALIERQHALLAERRAIMAARVRLGETGRIPLDDIDGALAGLAAARTLQSAQVAVLRNRLAIVTGVPAGTALPELAQATGLDHDLPADPAAGQPAEILRRRPDLRVAEARLVAANARIGQALAEFWPKLSLSGLAGFDTTRLGAFATDPASVVTGAAGLNWRILDFGRVEAEVAGARGAAHEALAAWRGAVLQAGADVENAFAQLAARRGEAAAQTAALAAARDALARTARAAALGEASRDARLERETAALAAEDKALAARTEAWLALAAACRALGG